MFLAPIILDVRILCHFRLSFFLANTLAVMNWWPLAAGNITMTSSGLFLPDFAQKIEQQQKILALKQIEDNNMYRVTFYVIEILLFIKMH